MISLGPLKKLNKAEVEAYKKREKAKRKAQEVLEAVDFPTEAIDILALLENKEKLDIILRKLKLKAFW